VRRETSPLLGRRCRVQRAPWVHAQSARVVVLALLFLAASATGALAEAFQGKVVGVADGDTITVLNERRPETIRLNGIDAPEKGQAFGERAKQFTAHLAFGQIVQVIVRDQDRYGRTVADVRLPTDRTDTAGCWPSWGSTGPSTALGAITISSAARARSVPPDIA
jgi:endonuclease YncB( thermonuclease family)